MKKLLSLVLVVVFAMSMLLGGCGAQETPAPATTAAPAESTAAAPAESTAAAPAAPAKVFELKYNDFNPAGVKITDLLVESAANLEKASNGGIKITNYFSGTLLKYPETFKGVSTGVADLSMYLMGGAAGIHTFSEVFNLPFLGFKDYAQCTKIYSEILKKYPEFDAENEKLNVKLVAIRPMLPANIHSTKKKITSIADIKGEKVIAEGHYSRAIVAAGGTALGMGPTDWYSSLQKGVAGHMFNHNLVINDFKIYELTKYHTIFGAGGAGNGTLAIVANLESWKSLPAEYQALITKEYEAYHAAAMAYDIETEAAAVDNMKKLGQEFIELTPDQVAEWSKVAGEPTIAKWIADTEAAGYPGQKIIDDIRAMIAADK